MPDVSIPLIQRYKSSCLMVVNVEGSPSTRGNVDVRPTRIASTSPDAGICDTKKLAPRDPHSPTVGSTIPGGEKFMLGTGKSKTDFAALSASSCFLNWAIVLFSSAICDLLPPLRVKDLRV